MGLLFHPDTYADDLSAKPCSNDTQCKRRHANPLMKCVDGKCEEEKCRNNSVCPMDALCIKGHCIDVGLVTFKGLNINDSAVEDVLQLLSRQLSVKPNVLKSKKRLGKVKPCRKEEIHWLNQGLTNAWLKVDNILFVLISWSNDSKAFRSSSVHSTASL